MLLTNNIEIFRLQYRQYCQDKIWLSEIEKYIHELVAGRFILMVSMY